LSENLVEQSATMNGIAAAQKPCKIEPAKVSECPLILDEQSALLPTFKIDYHAFKPSASETSSRKIKI